MRKQHQILSGKIKMGPIGKNMKNKSNDEEQILPDVQQL
jgi:hypothetical protein